MRTLVTSHRPVLALAYSPDSRQLAHAGLEDTIKILTCAGEEFLRIETEQRTVNHIIWSHRSNWIASSGNDRNIKVWEATTGRRIKVLEGHRNAVYCQALSANGELLASGGRDGTNRLWDTLAWIPRATLRGHKHSVLSLAFHANGKLIASGGADGTIRFWDVQNFELLRTVESGHIAVQFVAFSPNGQQLASGGADATIRFWEPTRTRREALS